MDHYILDDYAQTNALRDQDTRLKLLLGTGAMVICAASPGPVAPLAIAASMSVIILVFAKIPLRLYLSLLSIPFSFALFGCIVILFMSGGGSPLVSFPLFGITLTITTGLSEPCPFGCSQDPWRDVLIIFYCPDNADGRALFSDARTKATKKFCRSIDADL